ncbi:MAG: leucine-rich repeat domain-containing protein, partial [Opitutae bacterium]
MRFICTAFLICSSWLWAEENVISQARFFRLLGIKPTEQDAAPFGGLKTVVLTHKALVDKKLKLEFADEGIQDLRPFSYLNDLQWLRLSHNPVKDLTPLADLKNLQVLSLYGIPKMKNASARISDLRP